MNEIITDFLAQHFINLNFISRAAGCVTILSTKSSGKPRKIPVARLVYKSEDGAVTNCDIAKDYHNLVPDGKETGILYFEEIGGAKVVDSTKRVNTFEGKLKLVFWANLKLIGEANTLGVLETNLIANLPREVSPNGSFFGATVRVTNVLPKRPSPFDIYTYDEVRTQYLTTPYGYTSLEITYKARASTGCTSNIILNPEIC